MKPTLCSASVKRTDTTFTVTIESVGGGILTHENVLMALLGTVRTYCERNSLDFEEFVESMVDAGEVHPVPFTMGEA